MDADRNVKKSLYLYRFHCYWSRIQMQVSQIITVLLTVSQVLLYGVSQARTVSTHSIS
jgi:hypothetical protein